MSHIGASEWLERLADAMETMRDPKHVACTEEGCTNPIRRGIRCEECRRKRHAAVERARFARNKAKSA